MFPEKNNNNIIIISIFLIVISSVSANALELNFNGWKKFMDNEDNGFAHAAYQRNQDQGDFQIIYISHVNIKKDEFTYVQSISVVLKGTENILADVMISYKKKSIFESVLS